MEFKPLLLTEEIKKEISRVLTFEQGKLTVPSWQGTLFSSYISVLKCVQSAQYFTFL